MVFPPHLPSEAEVQDLAKRVPPEPEKKHRAVTIAPVSPSSANSGGARMQGQRSLPVLGPGGHTGGMRRMQSLPQLVKSGRGPNLPRRAWDLETASSPTKKKGVRR